MYLYVYYFNSNINLPTTNKHYRKNHKLCISYYKVDYLQSLMIPFVYSAAIFCTKGQTNAVAQFAAFRNMVSLWRPATGYSKKTGS